MTKRQLWYWFCDEKQTETEDWESKKSLAEGGGPLFERQEEMCADFINLASFFVFF